MRTDLPEAPGRLPAGLLFVQLVGAIVDFGALGLTSSGGFDLGKWLFLMPGLLFGIYLFVSSTRLMQWLLAGPVFLLMLWFAWAVFGVSYSVAPQATLLQMVVALTTTVGAFWYVRSYGLERFARVFCLAAALVLGIGLANDLIPAVAAVLPLETSQTAFAVDTGRTPGITPGVNQLGMLAGLTAMMAIRLDASVRYIRIGRYALFGMAALAMMTAGSRSVAVCTIAALAVQVGVGSTPIVRRRGAVASVAAVLVAFGFISASGAETTFQSGRSLDSLNGRGDVWSYASELVSANPLRGVGMMAGEVTWARAFEDRRVSFDAGDAHNTALELLVGTGSIGLALFASAAIWAAMRAYRLRDADAIAVLLLLGFVGLTEALVSAAGLVYSMLGVVMALVAVDRRAFPWPNGRGGRPDVLLDDDEISQLLGAGA